MESNSYQFDLINSIVTFILQNDNTLKIQAYIKNNKQQIFAIHINNSTLPHLLINKHKNIQRFFQDSRYQLQQQDLKYTQNDISAKLTILLTNKQSVEFILKPKSQLSLPNPVILPNPSNNHIPNAINIVNSHVNIINPPINKNNPSLKIVNPSASIDNQSNISKIIIVSQNEQLKKLEQQEKLLDIQIQELQQFKKNKQPIKIANLKRLNQLAEQHIIATDQLEQVNRRLIQTKKKYISNPIQNHLKYGQYVEQQNGKQKLFMRQKNVDDSMIQEIVQCDLKKIQILSLGDNKISDEGFNFLFYGKQWPVLVEIYLQNNKIQNIHSLNTIDGLQSLVLYQNDLSQASCDFLCDFWWPYIKNMRLSFKKTLNIRCWKQLIKVMGDIFPNLEQIYYSRKQDLDEDTIQQILAFCNSKGISLNHSVNKDHLQNILALQMLQQLVSNT